MAEKSSSTVPVVVAIIGVLGTISAATIANWDKIMGGRSASSPTEAQPTAGNAAAPTDAARADAAESAKLPVGIDVSGTWGDADGHDYVFEQRGTQYSFRQMKGGTQVGQGEGSLVGNSFTHKFTGVYGEGRCAGLVTGNVASGTCTNGPQTWDMRVVRSASAPAPPPARS